MTFRIIAATALLLTATSAMAAPAKPASAVLVTNAREVAVTDVTVEAGGKTVRLAKPLAPKAKTTLKLPKMSGCTVTVAATFEDESTADLSEFDVCKDKNVRFTD
ncbi:hypothetical protein [Microvirga calopogonii]|uniref:hypothetical protein n=1 Tax=Microvirga calopogonii TaxID=2078013 RepID=UPI0013B41260|nr:hypothetical protein [Microvirga calopogonii]